MIYKYFKKLFINKNPYNNFFNKITKNNINLYKIFFFFQNHRLFIFILNDFILSFIINGILLIIDANRKCVVDTKWSWRY